MCACVSLCIRIHTLCCAHLTLLECNFVQHFNCVFPILLVKFFSINFVKKIVLINFMKQVLQLNLKNDCHMQCIIRSEKKENCGVP